jgi:hypothetical protein
MTTRDSLKYCLSFLPCYFHHTVRLEGLRTITEDTTVPSPEYMWDALPRGLTVRHRRWWSRGKPVPRSTSPCSKTVALETRGERIGGRGIEATKSVAWYINAKHGSYPGPKQCSLGWVFVNELSHIRQQVFWIVVDNDSGTLIFWMTEFGEVILWASCSRRLVLIDLNRRGGCIRSIS